MPRVSIKKKNYMMVDFSRWLVGKMKERDMCQTDIGELLGIPQQSVSKRIRNGLKGQDTFSHGEVITLFKELKATDKEVLSLCKS